MFTCLERRTPKTAPLTHQKAHPRNGPSQDVQKCKNTQFVDLKLVIFYGKINLKPQTKQLK